MKTPNTDFFIYAAADSVYFERYGKAFVNSILQNTDYHVHIHLFNPTEDQVRWCDIRDHRLTFSIKAIDTNACNLIASKWAVRKDFSNKREQQMFDNGKLHGFQSLAKIVENTLYACGRFTKLPYLLQEGQRCLSLDIDGIVRKPFDTGLKEHDLYLYQKPSGEHLAGAIMVNSLSFAMEYSLWLMEEIERDNVYWFLDQVILDDLVVNYDKGLLPKGYVDWDFAEDSAIWSAKGKRKDFTVFMNEQLKYSNSVL